MTRTMTALAAAAAAAILAAVQFAADTGTTTAAWHDTGSIAGETVGTGALAITNLTPSTMFNGTPTTATVLELDNSDNDTATLTAGVSARLAGTNLGAVLRVEYRWSKWFGQYASTDVNSLGKSAQARIVGGSSVTPPIGGSLTGGSYIEVLLWPESEPLPTSTGGRQVLRYGGTTPSVEIALTIEGTTDDSWALGASRLTGLAPNRHPADPVRGNLTATLTQFRPDGMGGSWSSSRAAQEVLPVLFNYWAQAPNAAPPAPEAPNSVAVVTGDPTDRKGTTTGETDGEASLDGFESSDSAPPSSPDTGESQDHDTDESDDSATGGADGDHSADSDDTVGGKPTEPEGTQPTEPEGTQPTEPDGTQPAEPDGTQAAGPEGAEADPSGDEPAEYGSAPTESEASEPPPLQCVAYGQEPSDENDDCAGTTEVLLASEQMQESAKLEDDPSVEADPAVEDIP